MRASRMAFSSADASRGSASCSTGPSCPSCLSCPSCFFSLMMMILWIADRVRRIRGSRPFVDANRSKAPRLEHTDQLQPDHFEQREERDDEPAAIVDVGEEILEPAR